MSEVDERELKARIGEILNRWPAVGLAVGVVRDGSLEFFHGHGVADIASSTPVTEDTVFRIASITKTFTAIAVMQLWEQGLVDLDAPANDYLRAYSPGSGRGRLSARHACGTCSPTPPESARCGSRRTCSRPTLGWGRPGGPAGPAARRVLPRAACASTSSRARKWAYSNHGFATLGQIVEDVSGIPLDRYLREHVFEPLGMDRHRPRPVRAGAASPGDRVRAALRRSSRPVADHEMRDAGGGAAYSTTSDMARYVAALLGGGANEHGSVLKPETLATHVRAALPARSPDPGHGPGVLPRRGRRTSDRGPRRDLEGLPLRHGARPRRGDRRRRLRQHRGVRPPRRARCPSRTRCSAACSASRMTPCAPTSRSARRSGATSAAGTPSVPACSPTPSPGRCSGPASRSSSAASHLTIRGQTPIPAVRRGLRLHPDGDDPLRLPHRSLRARVGHLSRRVQPGARRRGDAPCTSASLRCRSRSGPTCATRDRGSTARSSPAPRRSPSAGRPGTAARPRQLPERAMSGVDERELRARIGEILNRWAAVGSGGGGGPRRGRWSSSTATAWPTSPRARRSPRTRSSGSPRSPRPSPRSR